jgi:arylsulfatase A-like enzyme/tetratricopeptide (TPR) repeat protein
MSQKKILLVVVYVVMPVSFFVFVLIKGGDQFSVTKPNIVLISIDTCRADRLGCYGFAKNTTPNIDQLAKEGILYEQAMTCTGYTLPSHSSMFTGTYPPYHGVHTNLSQQLAASNTTMAEMLKDAGYETAGFVSSFVLNHRFGIQQGFDIYDDALDPVTGNRSKIERKGERTAEVALSFIKKQHDKPFFLFAHFYDPHVAFEPPEPFASQFSDDLYSGEIAYVDALVGKLIVALKESGHYDNSLIMIVSDHGEGLGEHGEAEHGYFIYQNTMQVPFIVKAPKNKIVAGLRVKEVVSTVDLLPTVLGFLDMDIPGEIQGIDLSEVGHNDFKLDPQRYVYCESMIPTKYGCNPLLGLVTQDFKFIETTRSELYDLDVMPLEKDNLIKKEVQRSKVMQQQLSHLTLSLVSGSVKDDASLKLDRDSLKKLESMGYVGGGDVDVSFSMDLTLPDPKDRIAFHESIQQITALAYKHEFDKAWLVLDKMVVEWPQMPSVWFRMGEMGFSQEDYALAIKHLKTYLEKVENKGNTFKETIIFNPDSVIIKAKNMLGESYLHLENFDEAVRMFSAIIKRKSENYEAYLNLGVTYFKQDMYSLALENFQIYLKHRPVERQALYNLSVCHFKLEDYKNALTNYKALKALDRAWPEIDILITNTQELAELFTPLFADIKTNPIEAHHEIAKNYYKLSYFTLALQHWEAQHQLEGNVFKTLKDMGDVCYRLKDLPKAVKNWLKALEMQPENDVLINNLAWVMASTSDPQIRNENHALTIIEDLVRRHRKVHYLDTYSMVLAAVGQFDKAIAIANEAIVLYGDANKQSIAALKKQITLFKDGKAYYE